MDAVLAVGMVFLLIVALGASLLAAESRTAWWARCDHRFAPPDYTTCMYCHRTIPLPPEEQ